MKKDLSKVKVGRIFKMTEVKRINGINEHQANTEVRDGKAIQTQEVKINWIEDRGEYLYIGFTPLDRRMGAFGATRVYKTDRGNEYGLLGFEQKYNYQEA